VHVSERASERARERAGRAGRVEIPTVHAVERFRGRERGDSLGVAHEAVCAVLGTLCAHSFGFLRLPVSLLLLPRRTQVNIYGIEVHRGSLHGMENREDNLLCERGAVPSRTVRESLVVGPSRRLTPSVGIRSGLEMNVVCLDRRNRSDVCDAMISQPPRPRGPAGSPGRACLEVATCHQGRSID
jgi:hypothetical protein